MKNFNLALAFVAVSLCLIAGALHHNIVLMGLSLMIALGAFLLNKKLEQRNTTERYFAKPKPILYDEISEPDLFE